MTASAYDSDPETTVYEIDDPIDAMAHVCRGCLDAWTESALGEGIEILARADAGIACENCELASEAEKAEAKRSSSW